MKAQLLSFLWILCTSLVFASYIIDDTNKTAISYYTFPRGSGSDLWLHYGPSDSLSFDKGKFHNQTISTSDSGWITPAVPRLSITFYGTGITLYGLRLWRHNASYELDSQSPIFKDFDADAEGIENTKYNYTLYDVQGLSLDKHTVEVKIYDHETTKSKGYMWFDYAVVNGADSNSPPSPPGKGGSQNGTEGSKGNAERIYSSTAGMILVVVCLGHSLLL